MTSFHRREEAFEAKFAHDAEREFKARARAMRMLGLWAADKRGLSSADAEDYARVLVEADVDKRPNLVFEQMVGDLAEIGIDARLVRDKRDALLMLGRRSQSDLSATPKVRGPQ